MREIVDTQRRSSFIRDFRGFLLTFLSIVLLTQSSSDKVVGSMGGQLYYRMVCSKSTYVRRNIDLQCQLMELFLCIQFASGGFMNAMDAIYTMKSK